MYKIYFKHFVEMEYEGNPYALPIIKFGNKKAGRRIKNKEYKIRILPLKEAQLEEVRIWDNVRNGFNVTKRMIQEVDTVGMKLIKTK